jgi:hypothetical protein
VTVTQEFVVGASILERKCQDHVEHYDHFCEQDSFHCTGVGPSIFGRSGERANRLTRDESKVVVEACWALYF